MSALEPLANGVADDLERNVISGNNGDGIIANVSSNENDDDGDGDSRQLHWYKCGGYGGGRQCGKRHLSRARRATDADCTNGSNDLFNANERNLISGNTSSGIQIDGASTPEHIIAGNWIGLNVAGNASLPNGSHGIRLNQVNARIGTDGNGIADTEERNVISGNNSNGIYVAGNGPQYEQL